MSEEQKPPTTTALIQIEPLVQQITTFLTEVSSPEGKITKAVAYMRGIDKVENEDDVEYANEVLGKVKTIYDHYAEKRMAITSQTDELKKNLMSFEKLVSPDGKTDNEYTRVRNLIQSYKQAELERVRAEEEKARRQRERDDMKVRLQAQWKKNLVDMTLSRVVEVDEGAAKHFAAATVENFDELAKKFKGFKPLLKPERFQQCFVEPFESGKITPEEFEAWKKEFQVTETYEHWSALVIDGITPVLNQWNARIPELKAEKIRIAQAQGEERERLEKEARDREAAEKTRKDTEFAKLKQQAQDDIQLETDQGLMHNAFKEQGVNQQIDSIGPLAKELRFTDTTQVPKALANIIYHCFLNPKFPGIYKLDKSKKPVVDESGVKQYTDQIDWWLRFFMANCDAAIPGTEVKEKAKVIVKR